MGRKREKQSDEVTGNGNTVAECTKKKDTIPERERVPRRKKVVHEESAAGSHSVGVLNGVELNLTDLREISNWSVSGSNWNE